MKRWEQGLAEADLVTSAGVAGVHLMAQPLGYRTPDAGDYGWATLPEYPYGEMRRVIFS